MHTRSRRAHETLERLEPRLSKKAGAFLGNRARVKMSEKVPLSAGIAAEVTSGSQNRHCADCKFAV